MNDYIKSLKNPENKYKPTPFWSWNDKLDPEELRWQVREMKKVGMGGYFMHARGGLITEYLGEDWFRCVDACIDEGSKLGMDSWAYDEDGWPSGFGGGIVTDLGDKYHVRWLECGCYGTDSPNGPVLGYYTIDSNNNYKYYAPSCNPQEITVTTDITNQDTSKVYFVCHNKNSYYVDILNPEVVRAFIDSTYEEYYSRMPEKFKDGTMPGFFTDEPQFANGRTPWSYIIPSEFESRYNYNSAEHLICLFKDLNNSEHFRYDFWKLVSDLYTKSFGKQIYDWCNEHGCQWTGHAMCEDDLIAQMRCTAGVMPLYEYMHKPGIDWLCRHISSPIIPKQVGSAARQLGKELVLTETFALCGWDVSLEELKWIAEWQFVNGVTSICQHLESYSIRGMRKRDYPPSIFYQSPWWDDFGEFNEYFSRLGKLLSEGDEPVDVLVLHPMHSGWIFYNDRYNTRIHGLDIDFERTLSLLSGLHIQYHLGDETIIASHGKVCDDKFIVGNCTYKMVVIPSAESLDETTYSLLCDYCRNGGKLISVGNMPSRINGRVDSRISELSVQIVKRNDEMILSHFSKEGLKNVSITDEDGEIKEIRYCERVLKNASGADRVFFLHNQDNRHSYDSRVRIDGITSASLLSLRDMSVIPVEQRDFDNSFTLHFEPMQSYVILANYAVPTQRTDVSNFKRPLKLNNSWSVDSCDPNCLTLDYASYSVDGGQNFEGPYPVLDVMDRLIKMRYDKDIVLKYVFETAEDFKINNELDFDLVHEYSCKNFKVYVNGCEASIIQPNSWLDKAFHRIDIKSFIRPGKNEILISGLFFQQKNVYDILFGENVHETARNKLTYDTEIESVYLVGDFGVYSRSPFTEGTRKTLITDGGFYISDRCSSLAHGEIVTQGYTFFRGKMTLSQMVAIGADCDNIVFKMKKPFAAMAKLYINDTFVKTFLWADYEADISSYLRPNCENKVSIELFIGNRNLLGPHHHPEGECYAVNPGSFGPNGNYSQDNWRERYCFVKAGLNV